MHTKRIQLKDASELVRLKDFVVRLKDFAGAIVLSEDKNSDIVKVQVMRCGAWEHPWYGPMIINENTLSDMVRNFENNVRRQDLPADYYHDSEGEAAGWFKTLSLSENRKELWADIQVTPKCKQMLNDKAIRYFSADFYFEWTDPETGVGYKNVLNGGGFVNRPFIKGMQPVTELSEGKTQMTLEEAKKLLSDKDAKIAEHEAAVKTLGESVKAKDGEIATLKAEKAKMEKDRELAEKSAKFEKLCSEGKACAAQKDAYLAGDMEKFLELAQQINPAPKGTEGGENKPTTLSEEEKRACKILNVSEEDFIKYNK